MNIFFHSMSATSPSCIIIYSWGSSRTAFLTFLRRSQRCLPVGRCGAAGAAGNSPARRTPLSLSLKSNLWAPRDSGVCSRRNHNTVVGAENFDGFLVPYTSPRGTGCAMRVARRRIDRRSSMAQNFLASF